MKSAADILREKGTEMIAVPPDATIQQALTIMVEHKIGAILVREGSDIIGIWTERDLMRNTLEPDFNPENALIRNYMVTGLRSAHHTESIYNLLDKFLGMRLRHLLIKDEERFIGLVSIGDVIKANLMEKTEELEKLNRIVSWDYYENWRWKKK